MTTPDAAAVFADALSRPVAEARDLVEQAADLGHPAAHAWLAVDDVVRGRDTVAALTRLRRVRPEDLGTDGMVIRPQPFHPTFGEPFDDGLGEFDPRYLVVTPDPQNAGRALDAAGVRLLRVTDTGVELGPDEDDGDAYTPNYVSEVEYAADGASIWTDCKGEITVEMADAMVDIVVEELRRARVVGVLAVPVDDLRRPAG